MSHPAQMEKDEKEEANKRCFQRTKKLLYFTYFIGGGVLTSKKTSRRVKYILVTLHFLAFILLVVGAAIYYVYNATIYTFKPTDDFGEFFMASVNIIIAMHGLGFVPIGAIIFHTETFAVLEYVLKTTAQQGEKFSFSTKKRNYSSVFIQKLNPLRIPIILLSINYVIFAIYSSIPIIYFILYCKKEDLIYVRHYVLLIPFYDRIASVEMYYLMSTMMFFMIMVILVCVSSNQCLFFILTLLLNNIIFNFCAQVEFISKALKEKFEQNMLFSKKKMETEMADEMIKLHRRFEKDLNEMIEKYCQFIRVIRSIRPYINFYSSILVFGVWVSQFSNAYIILVSNMELIYKFKQGIMNATITVFFYCTCYSGKMIEDMDDAVRNEVYNLPWYYLPPSTRKTINILQNLVKKSYEFKALGIYRMTMVLVPYLLKTVYSYVNVFRTISQHQNR